MTAYRFDNGSPQVGCVTISRPFRIAVVHAKLQAVNGRWRFTEMDFLPQFEFAEGDEPARVNQK
jgi:hypothetical protein